MFHPYHSAHGEVARSGVRIGDAERDEAVAVLWKHYEAGRLGPAEHEERCARARVAHRRGEIEALFADLPAPHADLAATVPPTAAATTPVAAPEADTAGERPTLSHVLDGVGVLVILLGVGGLVLVGEDYVKWWMVLLLTCVIIAIFWLAELVR